MNKKQELNLIRKLSRNLRKLMLPALAVVAALTVFYLYHTPAEIPKKVPSVVSSTNNPADPPTVNPLLLVNSTESSALNIELATQAEKQDEHEFNLAGDGGNIFGGKITFSGGSKFNDADIAAIAYGKLLQSIDRKSVVEGKSV